MSYFDVLNELMTETHSVPWQDGVLTCIVFFAYAALVSVGTAVVPRQRVHFLATLLFGALAIRYTQSYFVYHRGLLEGLWPIAFTLALWVGVLVGTSRAKRPPPSSLVE